MRNLYVIAGCNGAGKTTASYSILPEMLDCHEFVNADEIAKGLSPFQPETASFAAGRLMLKRIREHISQETKFAFETTLSTRSYTNLLREAKKNNYDITLLFFWLNSPELAVKRVATRVNEGGHNIPEDVIRRRYERGLRNFFGIFRPIVTKWMFIDNSIHPWNLVASAQQNKERIFDKELWKKLKQRYEK